MAIEFTSLELTELKPKVAVIGVGGAGGNAVNNMVQAKAEGIDFIAANTDAQALSQSLAKLKIQLGVETTKGLGAGSHPDVGRAAAEEALHQIEDALSRCHMVFITAGMGGGTGTGAAPVIAKAAKAKGILTIAVVTKPFEFEGNRRMKLAQDGIYELQPFVDTLVVIPNQNLFRVANKHTTFAEAFSMADDVLCSGVSGITDLMMHPGLINLDFADIKTIMQNMGTSMLGTGEASGENRALEAAETAISNPLLDEMSLASAKGVIINITGGNDLTLFEVDEAANHIRKEVDENANIILGSAFHSEMDGVMRVSIVATGVTYMKKSSARPNYRDDVANEDQATNLHFEIGADQEAVTGFDETRASAVADDEAPHEHSEVVGVVDDFVMPEAASVKESIKEFGAPQGAADPEAEADFIEAVGDTDEIETPDQGFAIKDQGFAIKEMHREGGGQLEEPSVFDEGRRRNLFQESLEFIADEEDPPLIEEAAAHAPKKSLFSRMTSGIKGVFGGADQTTQERAEPSMENLGAGPGAHSDEIAEDKDMDNILNIDSRDEEGEDAVPEAEDVEKSEEEIEDDDQLAIPSFLRKQA